MKSMTGFGSGEAALGNGKVLVEVRAINYRYLDVRVRMPKELADYAMLVEQGARERLSRGRCEIVVRIQGPALCAMRMDRDRARTAFQAFAEVRDELAPGAELPLSLLSAVPDLFVPALDQETPHIREALLQGLLCSLANMDVMRRREGEALLEDLRVRVRHLRTLEEAIVLRSPEVINGYRKRMRERIRILLASADFAMDEARMEQEVVLFADRSDISEELTRLRIHIDGLDELLMSTESIGRKLDFLLQEIGREVNTLGSKAQDAMVARAVVEAKAEIERMREQVQNVE